jgi:hypothetical protein
MTKRDFFFLLVAPVVMLAIAADLLWLGQRLHDGAERRLADHAVLQERVSAPARTDSTPKASERAALTLSHLAMESHESDAATVTVSTSLAALLLAVSFFQILTVFRLLRNQHKLASVARSEIGASNNAPLRPSGVGAARSGLSSAGNPTLL